MQIWSHGRQHQVLVKETGINRCRRKEETDMGSWWAEICNITKWDPQERYWRGEMVKYTEGHGRGAIRINWSAPH